MTTITPELTRRVNEGAETNAWKCYQCRRCSIGCPVASYGDLHPAQIMRAVQFGDIENAAASKFIWLCTGCETCTTRCPQGIDIAAVMDELRKIAREEQMVTKDAGLASVLKLNLDSMKRWGRMSELELVALDKLSRPSSMMNDVGLGLEMFRRGKLPIIPGRGDRKKIKEMWSRAEAIEKERRSPRRVPIADAEGGEA